MVTLLAVTAALDNSIIVRLEAWLEQGSLEPEARALASKTQAATACANESPASMTDATDTCAIETRAVESAAWGARGREETEGRAPPPAEMHAHATMIQSQVRRCAHTPLRKYSFPHSNFNITAPANGVCPVESLTNASRATC